MKEENISKKPFLKQAMNYGAILGIALIVYSLILYLLNLSTERFLSYVTYVIIIIGLYLAAKKYRDEYHPEMFSYGKALGFSFVVIIFAAFLSAFYTYIFFQFIDPGQIDKMMLLAEEQLYNRGISEAEIEMSIEITRKMMTPSWLAIMGFLGTVFAGFIIALITSIFIKKTQNTL